MAVLQLLVITLFGLPILWILTLPYIFPGVQNPRIFHRYKFLPFFANASIFVPFFCPGVNSFFIDFARVF